MLDIQVHGTRSEALVDHVSQQVSAALAPMESLVQNVLVRLSDENGRSKGNDDKRCHVTVFLKRTDPVVIDEANGDMYHAVSKAADRLKNVIAKRHDKRMEKLHGH